MAHFSHRDFTINSILAMFSEEELKRLSINSSLIKEPRKLKKYIEKSIYEYRSDLVHERHRIISYAKNNMILSLASNVIFFVIKYSLKENINSIKEFQMRIDLYNRVNKII